jgi:hypothetical protein
MTDQKWVKLDDLRQPGMRRILDAMRQIKEEAPGLIEEALTASIELAKRQNGGRLPQ